MFRSLQARLVLAFTLLVGIALVIVAVTATNRLDEYFRDQERIELEGRAVAAISVVASEIQGATANGEFPIIDPSGQPSAQVEHALGGESLLRLVADLIAQGDVEVAVQGEAVDGSFVTAGTYRAATDLTPTSGQSRQQMRVQSVRLTIEDPWWASPTRSAPHVQVLLTISDPYTFRDRSTQTVIVLLVAVGALVLVIAAVFSLLLAQRLTTPVRRLEAAARALEVGELHQRVPVDPGEPRELVELSEQFNRMADRLEESIRIVREDRDRSRDFLADVSHELRTPVAALRTFNELLRDGADLDPATRAEFLQVSAQQIERLDWLATNLLELSKLDSGLVALELRPDDLRAAVEGAVESAEPDAGRKGVELRAELPPNPVRTRHDQQRVGQLIGNLIDNAVKFTPAGGRVVVRLEPADDGATISVADTGIGIGPEELPHIFDRFYRGTRAAEARAAGSGLGLAIVKSIVDMHRGRISVDSRSGEGTTVTVRLPRDPASVAAA
ncbi:MAG: hypothetical protein A2X23_08495 [Chloroflexi bacterium GWC2_73_18]|nr:MAG: hypothetical protein A2X23_08495 [Chloroflexi bacterium GWC2_73_18]